MKKAWKVYWPFLLLVPFVAAGIIGWFVLPAEITISGAGTLPKLVALLVPVALGALGSAQTCFEGQRRMAGVVILILAAVAEILVFARNL